MTQTNIVHEDGLVFIKCAADSGITYKSLEVKELEILDRAYLVRHGDPETGRCGYYPVWLILASQSVRVEKAQELGKRAPSTDWVRKTRKSLEASGAAFLH